MLCLDSFIQGEEKSLQQQPFFLCLGWWIGVVAIFPLFYKSDSTLVLPKTMWRDLLNQNMSHCVFHPSYHTYRKVVMLNDILMAKTTKQGLFMDIGLDSGWIIGSLQTANKLMGEKLGWWSPN